WPMSRGGGRPPLSNGNEAAAQMVAALSEDAGYAFRNIKVVKGKLVIGEELRADLRGEGHSGADIDLALPRALERGGGSSDPTKILPRIRWALSYVRQDKAKIPPRPNTFGKARYAK